MLMEKKVCTRLLKNVYLNAYNRDRNARISAIHNKN